MLADDQELVVIMWVLAELLEGLLLLELLDGDDWLDAVDADEMEELDEDSSAVAVVFEKNTSPFLIFIQAEITFCPRNLPTATLEGLSYSPIFRLLASVRKLSEANISSRLDKQKICGFFDESTHTDTDGPKGKNPSLEAISVGGKYSSIWDLAVKSSASKIEHSTVW